MIRKYLSIVTATMNFISIIALVVILFMMFTDIVLRYTLQISVLGAYELIEYLMVIAIGFCMAHTEILDGHVRVTMLTAKFGKKINAAVRFIGCLMQSMMLFFIMAANIQQAQYILTTHANSAVHRIPAYPFYYVVAVSFGLFGVVMLLRAFETLMLSSQKTVS